MMNNRISILVFCAFLVSCRQAEKEAARTSEQLGRLARATGTDQMYDSVAKSYQDNLQPMMRNAGSAMENYESLKAAREMGAQACEKISDFGSDMGQAADRAMSRMPQNERELNQSIDYYNDEFVAWLRANFQGLDLGSKSGRVGDRLGPRGRPKTKHR